MSDDLVNQLDELIAQENVYISTVKLLPFRDRIEQLEREKARLGREVNMAKYGEPNFAWSMHSAAMADLQAKLAKAVETLREIVSNQGYMDDPWGHALAALAELEGGE